MTQISISEASRQWKIGRSTIQRKIQSGELSVSQLDTSKKNSPKLIDIAELIRVFGESDKKFDTSAVLLEQQNEVSISQSELKVKIHQLEAENRRLIEQNDKLLDSVLSHDKKLLEHQTKPLWKKLLSR